MYPEIFSWHTFFPCADPGLFVRTEVRMIWRFSDTEIRMVFGSGQKLECYLTLNVYFNAAF